MGPNAFAFVRMRYDTGNITRQNPHEKLRVEHEIRNETSVDIFLDGRDSAMSQVRSKDKDCWDYYGDGIFVDDLSTLVRLFVAKSH